MTLVSLIAVAAQLGKTAGTIKLSELRDNGYARTFAGSGYRRVNPFEVENDNAQDPNEAGTQHRLGDWIGYIQSTINQGSNLLATGGYGDADLSWSLPSGYSRATSILNQRVYVKDTGETSFNETALSTNPFSSPDQSQSLGDATSLSGLNLASYEGNVVAIGIKAEFDDSVATHESPDGTSYSAHASAQDLTGAGAGIALFVIPSIPEITGVTQTTDPDSCFGGDPVNIRIDITSYGSSLMTLQRSVNGGAWSTVDSSVSAGTSQINRSEISGNSYRYRIQYNDVGTYSGASSSTSAICNLV